MKYSRKGGELQPTHPNVNSEISQVPLASQAQQGTWLPHCWHWGWDCTWCTLQTSSPPPCRLRSGELVCKVHLVQFQLKYTRGHAWVHLSSQARIGVLKHELGCTWVETAEGALCRQVLRSRACEAEENLSAKCTECSFNPNVNKEVAKYPDAELARRGVLGLPLSLHWD